jgi:DNA replication protein DnaC
MTPHTPRIQPAPAEPAPILDDLRQRATKLHLFGLLSHFDELAREPWVPKLIDLEETARKERSLARRIAASAIGRFTPMADFDWAWPKKLDRAAVEELFALGFITEACNVILAGPNGVGKTMIAQNLAYNALMQGHTVRFTTASNMLNDLAMRDGHNALMRRLKTYCAPELLVIDELGYLSYDNRHADLLYEVVSQRYQKKPIVLTTNKPFAEWNQVFPNAASVVVLVDRLVHKSEIITVAGDSYRVKEARERAQAKATRSRRSAK